MSVYKYFKQNLAAMDKNLKRDLADNETLHANQAKVIKENYGLEIDSKNQAYDDDLRANEVQKYINMREVAENNANLGLSDSGLNRTQSTAVQLSASNNAAKIERDRNNMVRSLETEMDRYLTEIENSRISSAASIKKGYEDSAWSSAVDQYKADVDAEAKVTEAAIQAQTEASKEARTALTAFIKDFEENSYDRTQAAKKVKNYIDLYGCDTNTLSLLLSNAGISGDEYSSYCDTGSFDRADGNKIRSTTIEKYKERYGDDLTYLSDGGIAINGKKVTGYALNSVYRNIANLNKPVVTKVSGYFHIKEQNGTITKLKISELPESVRKQLTDWSKGNYVGYEYTPWGKQ